ncbi:hypothetical protein TVAG_054010 [Trichomonas vaginalis G3]|uniref:DUF3447 domain-containing protein n=1 Tax=Trichomonas vaginalis (strain ATCC PRA-98 / G3) TaxID=412133 RepID=A2G1K3_TRIV3|nr:spectrin binding [Trichomonas vaginalis G3]EAX88961.1 hypothetical protein TVAG_054010 [Trichomonas vaginalis G3]KAI5484907.1 spectrin binding [Trichomonas vaginalis G3]|eukprot:XP_001301891.1 hypothetical protein [Trichomonas vaginalis G3]
MLKSCNETEIFKLYDDIKNKIIETKILLPSQVLTIITNASLYNNRYTRSYWTLCKRLIEEYHPNQIQFNSHIFYYFYYKEYGVVFDKPIQRSIYKYEHFENSLDVHEKNTIYEAIMNDNKELFISLTEISNFKHNQILKSDFYPNNSNQGYSLLELCCYYGSVNCFKFLRTKFNSKITPTCLQFSFLGGNPDIMSECLKSQKPDKECMKYAIISHNIDFATYLMNEHRIPIDIKLCNEFNNIEASFVYLDKTKDISDWLNFSSNFHIPSLWKYLISKGIDINTKCSYHGNFLHLAVIENKKEKVEFLLLLGADIDAGNINGKTPLILAMKNRYFDIAKYLVEHGANVNAVDNNGDDAINLAIDYNHIDLLKLFISHGNINGSPKKIPLHNAISRCNEELTEFLISMGANVNEKDIYGKTALHLAALQSNIELAEFLISNGANIHLRDSDSRNTLYYALSSDNCTIELIEFLISKGANVNSKDFLGKDALHYAMEKTLILI